LGYNWATIVDIETTKTIVMEKELADRIQNLAEKERRSFAREAQVLLEAALGRLERERESVPAAEAQE
jgi:predicted transcriptional regulator